MKNVKYISASAGSGKTYTLTQELTKAIKGKKVEPENVILTTFTKAAASEFKEKAKAMLYENGLVTEADRLDQAMIGTIHSVAESFIYKYWYVLGLSPEIKPIEDEKIETYRKQILNNIILEEDLDFLNYFAEEYEIKLPMSSKINYDFWKEDLFRVIEYSRSYEINDYSESIALSKKFTKSLVHGAHHINIDFDVLDEILKKAKQANEEGDIDEELNGKIEYHKRQITIMKDKPKQSIRYAKELKKFIEKLPKRGNAWKRLNDLKESFLENISNFYSSEEVKNDIDQYIETIFKLANELKLGYQEYKKEHRLIDFNDMEMYFVKLLDSKDIAQEISQTYKYVFVDEFQDCSPIQVKIFDKLSEIVESNIWVGDKKQAIYGFRGSDTILTTAVMDIIKQKEANGEDSCSTSILDKSWRSLPSLVDFTNKVFTKAFYNEDKKSVCLKPQRKEGKGFLAFWYLEETKADARFAQLTANIIELINNGEKPSDIAVLARTNSDLDKLAGLLTDAGVPVYRESIRTLTFAPALVKALLELIIDETAELPKAEIAFLTEKNYTIGKILDDKLKFNSTENKKLFYDNIPLVKKIIANRDRYKFQPIPQLVQSLIIELDLHNIVTKFNEDTDTTESLNAIIELAFAYQEECETLDYPSSLMGFISFLNEGVCVSGSRDGVQLYTFHGSKGLEWKTVILLGCDEDIIESKNLIKRNIFGVRVVRDAELHNENLFPKVSLTVFPNLFSGNTNIPDEWSSKIQQSEKYSQIEQTEIEEAKRLMYVAMTRAKDKMIFVLNGKRGIPEPLLTFEQFGFDVSDSFLEKYCDLLGVGIKLEQLENTSPEIEYQQNGETKAKTLRIENKPKTIYDARHIQPSNLPGGKVKAKVFVLSSCWCDG